MNITEELIEQTYQFCYGRLSNPDDARDLAQDILCEALDDVEKLCENITVINKGHVTFDDTMENLKTYYSRDNEDRDIADISIEEVIRDIYQMG